MFITKYIDVSIIIYYLFFANKDIESLYKVIYNQ